MHKATAALLLRCCCCYYTRVGTSYRRSRGTEKQEPPFDGALRDFNMKETVNSARTCHDEIRCSSRGCRRMRIRITYLLVNARPSVGASSISRELPRYGVRHGLPEYSRRAFIRLLRPLHKYLSRSRGAAQAPLAITRTKGRAWEHPGPV